MSWFHLTEYLFSGHYHTGIMTGERLGIVTNAVKYFSI
jgi:hypothetical protein